MQRFWDDVTRHVLDAATPRRIVEIGIGQGVQTRAVAEWAHAHAARFDAIDPRPGCDVPLMARRYPGVMTWHEDLSLRVLAALPAVDVALVDGDHNWFTVHNELRLLFEAAEAGTCAPPVVICHDVAWPYGRRDVYYDPDTIPPEFRHPFRKAGMLPDTRDLVGARGINSEFFNAEQEGGSRNGTLTAIEDFLGTIGHTIEVFMLPLLNGLGILIPHERVVRNAALADLVVEFRSVRFYDALLRLAEKHRLESARTVETLVRRRRAVSRRVASGPATL
jgi:hypothetical protein